MKKAKQKLEEKPVATVGFGSQGGKKKKGGAVYVTEEQIKTEIRDTRLSVSIMKSASVVSPTQVELRKRYRTERYSLHPGYGFPESVRSLVPRGTPEYIDKGFNYVERIVRALYHFKQCALIGPSGTVKTHAPFRGQTAERIFLSPKLRDRIEKHPWDNW